MTYQEVVNSLKSLKNERGIANYQKTFGMDFNYYGLGLTNLRKIAKKIKRDEKISEKLSQSNYLEEKILAVMVDNPEKYTKKYLDEFIVSTPDIFYNHPLSYFAMMLTEYVIVNSPEVEQIISSYAKSKTNAKRFIAFSALAGLGHQGKSTDSFFLQFLDQIINNIQQEDNNVKDAMNTALLYWGKRSKELNSKIIQSFSQIGEVVVDYGDTSCKTPNVKKMLLDKKLQEKLNNK